MRDTDNLGPAASGETSQGVWPYLGVGCMTAIAGLVAGGMIAVLIAKIVGSLQGCKPDAETGAPCDWATYWTWGARIGLVLLPTVVIMRMRKARAASRNSK
ncbi:MAG TPA: hypothetical protein VFY85_04275 [Gemmatimonadaceae bacterium]|nr:hypothetical protein [Gemmatimonadaceae bacterium]